MLNELSYFQLTNGKNRLLYSETGSKVINELCKPAHRLSLAEGNWPAAGRNLPEVHLRMIRSVASLADAAKHGENLRSQSLAALSVEEAHCAEILLTLLDYCAGRNINIGKAAMLWHYSKSVKEM